MRGILSVMLCALMLGACAHQGGGKARSPAVHSSKGSYQQAERYFRQGKLSEARQQLLAIGQHHPDYAKAQIMLKQTVEPARKRMIRYYRHKAAKESRRKAWFAAWQTWEEAASLSSEKKDRQQANAMLRQFRAERAAVLGKQRRHEDKQLERWLQSYQPGKAFDANDRIFSQLRQQYQQWLDHRVEQSLRLAKKLRKDTPEIALLLLESVVRLAPDRVPAGELEVLRAVVSKQLQLRTHKRSQQRIQRTSGHPSATRAIALDLRKIEQLVKQQQWRKALSYRKRLKQAGSKKARDLLTRIERGAKAAAAAWYTKGLDAFASEQVDNAVRLFDQAATLAPGNEEYLDALMRATKVQERLRLIRQRKE